MSDNKSLRVTRQHSMILFLHDVILCESDERLYNGMMSVSQYDFMTEGFFALCLWVIEATFCCFQLKVDLYKMNWHGNMHGVCGNMECVETFASV